MEDPQITPDETPEYLSIPVSNGKAYALIDAEDYELASQYNWHLLVTKSSTYAVANISKAKLREMGKDIPDGKQGRTRIYLHTLIMGWRKGFVVDHLSCDSMDCRRSTNLRWATSSENSANRRKRANLTSIYKGVCWNKKSNKWAVHIACKKKFSCLGRFNNEIQAARVYDEAALARFGHFARLNFPRIEGKVA